MRQLTIVYALAVLVAAAVGWRGVARRLSALQVAARVPLEPDEVILGVDTIVVLGEQILGKAADEAQARPDAGERPPAKLVTTGGLGRHPGVDQKDRHTAAGRIRIGVSARD